MIKDVMGIEPSTGELMLASIQSALVVYGICIAFETIVTIMEIMF